MTQPFTKKTLLVAFIFALLFSTSSWASIICKLNKPTLNMQLNVPLTLTNSVNFASEQYYARAPSLFCLLGANPQAVANGVLTSSHSFNGYGEIATSIPGVAIQFALGASSWKRQLPYTLRNSVSGLNMQDIGMIFISAINRTPGSLANYKGPRSVTTRISFKETRQKLVNATYVWVTIEGTVNVTINLDIGSDGGTGGGGTGGTGGGTGGGGTGGTGGGIASCSPTITPSASLNFGDLRIDQLDGVSVRRKINVKIVCSGNYPYQNILVRAISSYGGTNSLINSSKKEVGIIMTEDSVWKVGDGYEFSLRKDESLAFDFSPILNPGSLGSVEGVFSASVVFQILML